MATSILWRMSCVLLASILVTLGTVGAIAQSNSRAMVAKDIRGQYILIKRIIEPHRGFYAEDIRSPNKNDTYNLADCGSFALNFLESSDETTATLGNIAAHYLMWTAELPKVGYSRESIAPFIQDYEKTLLDIVASKGVQGLNYDIIHREGQRLAKKLNDLRSRQHLDAERVEYMDECGGGGNEITFVVPSDAHMYMASSFFVEICQKQGIDPSDHRKCNQYVDVPNGTKNRYAGLFTYIGVWDDGHTRTGQIDADRVGVEGAARVFRLAR